MGYIALSLSGRRCTFPADGHHQHHRQRREDHLADLLCVLPWQPQQPSGGIELTPDGNALLAALDQAGDERLTMFRNGQLDFEPLLTGKREDSLVWRCATYALAAFDAAPEPVARELGILVRDGLGAMYVEEVSLGRRWVEDVSATCYRLLLRQAGRDRREPADVD